MIYLFVDFIFEKNIFWKNVVVFIVLYLLVKGVYI